ncbi:hypothetical protein QQ056_00105, partial [Oscillatoria laete-virens NRMC-F 0139]
MGFNTTAIFGNVASYMEPYYRVVGSISPEKKSLSKLRKIMYLDKFKARFAELQHLFPYKLLPCREEQIYSLERQY